VLAIALAGGTRVSAHRLDEYLQAARIAIDPDRVRVELDLTPGVAVADRVLSDIDRDRDGSISSAEASAYVERVRAALSLDVDGIPLTARVTSSVLPPVAAVLAGEGTIRIQLAAPLPRMEAGAHHLRFRNGHRPDVGVYMANALVPANDRIAVTDQSRDADQRMIDVEYQVSNPAVTLNAPGMLPYGMAGVLLAGGALAGVAVRICRTLTGRNTVGCRIVQPGGHS
jgi:hypothetical protein